MQKQEINNLIQSLGFLQNSRDSFVRGSELMKKEYDFSKAEQGKFYRPIDELEIPVCLDKEVKVFYSKKAMKKNVDLSKVVNTILRKEYGNIYGYGNLNRIFLNG